MAVTLTAASSPPFELPFGYLSYYSGLGQSASLEFTPTGDADRCVPIRLLGSLAPNYDKASGEFVWGPGRYDVTWNLINGENMVTESVDGVVVLSAQGGAPEGSMEGRAEASSSAMTIEGTFELNECEAWRTSGS